jgi:hypothetical protein
MLSSIRCQVCGKIERVNGQKQISAFGKYHSEIHNLGDIDRITARTIDLNNPQDRITLKIDPIPLKTH